MAIQVFEINDCEWWAGDGSPLDILNHYMQETGCSHEDATGGEDIFPVALTDAQLRAHTFASSSSNQKLSFLDVLNVMILQGSKFPCLFAVSEY